MASTSDSPIPVWVRLALIVALPLAAVGLALWRNYKSATAKPAPKAATTVRDFTCDELAEFKGNNGAPVYLSARGVVFDATAGANFYGPGGPYSGFAGRDATIALAKMKTELAEVAGLTMDDLSSGELQTLNNWVTRFNEKYRVVGYLTDGLEPKSVASEEGKKRS